MKTYPINSWISIVLSLAGLLLIAVLFVPIWRIDLDAPQYPEGLQLLIYPHKLGGNVDIINGLNHYIGMKTLHTEDFFEFTILPYLIVFFATMFLLVAMVRKRKLMYFLCFLFISFGVIAMLDFYKWEYNYGHNLNPDAAIIVPGMAYQPPLIGFKQLLNFGAYSVPHIGGWIFITSGALLFFCVVVDFIKHKQVIKLNSALSLSTVAMICFFITSCSSQPQPIKIGIDNCQFCKMTVSEERYGAEVLTKKGKVYKFDDIKCMTSFIQQNDFHKQEIKDVYMIDFCGSHQLIKHTSCFLLKSDELKSPMGGNIIAFSSNDSLKKYAHKLNSTPINWNEIINLNP